jgi:predicted PurR-regulated permease PerM
LKEALRNPWLRLATVAAGVVLLGWVLMRLLEILTPFVVAFALAYFLNPAANALERLVERGLLRLPWLSRRIAPRMVAVGTLVAVVLVVLALALLIVVPAVYHQTADAVARMPDYARVLRARVEPWLDRVQLRYPEQAEMVRERLQQTLQQNLPGIVSPLTRVVQGAFSSALSFVLALLNLLVIPVFAAYLVFDMNRIRAGLKDLVPHRLRPYVYSRLSRVDRLLGAFVRGQITVALLLGAFYAVALTACGVPLGLVVGFAIGLLNLVPFLSHVVGLPLALVLSWLDDQSANRLLVVAGVFAVGQFVEGNFVTPRIVGSSLGLHAVVIMLAVLLGGTLFGFTGMLVAVPVTAALSVFFEDLKALYLRSDFYRRGDPAAAGGLSSTLQHAKLVLDSGATASVDSSHRVQDDSD